LTALSLNSKVPISSIQVRDLNGHFLHLNHHEFSPGSRENALKSDENWDFIINLAAETKPNQTQAVYHQGIVPLSLGCAELASKLRVKKFIEVSDSHCYHTKKVHQCYYY